MRPCLALLPMLLATAPAWAAADTYRLDPVHTRVLFSIDHAGYSQAMGTVSGSHGDLWFDPDDWSAARVVVEVPLDRLDMGDARWTRAVLAPNLLDARGHPVARFASNRIEPRDASHARACGDLTVRGITRDICMDVAFNQLKRHPLPPFRRTAGFSASATLKRSDFGIDAWKSVIGDEVQLRIEAEAVRARAGSGDPGADRDAGPDDDAPATQP